MKDRNNSSLWYNVDELIKNITIYNNKTIVATTTGSVNIESFAEDENVTAVLMSSYLGQETGSAAANVLVIIYLVELYSLSQKMIWNMFWLYIILHTTLDAPQDDFTRSIFLDNRYYDYNITPKYEFSYDLSYSNFNFGSLTVSEVKVPSKEFLQNHIICHSIIFHLVI